MEPDFSSFRNEWGQGRMVLVPGRDTHGRPYCVGASISVDDVHARVRETMWRSVAIGFGILAVSLLPVVLISATLSRPIVRLTAVADGIAHGDMTQTIDARGSVEMKLLAGSLSDMRSAIQKTMRELRQHRDHLEELVHERTAELERSNKELEQFAYVASHDLREPLRKVKSFAELFARKYEGRVDEQGSRYIHFLVDGAQRMQKLIEDLLTYSRVGRDEEAPASVDLAEVVRDVLRSVDAAIEDAGAEVVVEDLPTVHVNARLMGMVFQNLILNAVKFRGEAPPRVCVGSEQRDREWVISVQDNGIGIDPKHAERIFQIFRRLHGREEYPGTGIGLAVSRKIVERYGGRMWVESEPGKGSTFHFTVRDRSAGQ
jgi:signal transduction histidine kinase